MGHREVLDLKACVDTWYLETSLTHLQVPSVSFCVSMTVFDKSNPHEATTANHCTTNSPPTSFFFVCFPNRQVINAALTLAARPQSKVAQDNMDVFKDQWEKQVRILTEAVDDITSVDDFLSVSGMRQCRGNSSECHKAFTHRGRRRGRRSSMCSCVDDGSPFHPSLQRTTSWRTSTNVLSLCKRAMWTRSTEPLELSEAELPAWSISLTPRWRTMNPGSTRSVCWSPLSSCLKPVGAI